MKKILALLIALAMLAGVVSAFAEETEQTEQVGKYDRLTVATTTAFNGNFFSEALGNNISDQDVRRLIHGYNLVYWDSPTGSYQFNGMVVPAAAVSDDGMTFTFALAPGLTYNDGTPITAKDYAFSLLLQGSRELEKAAGGRISLSRILGGNDYQDGTSNTLKGFRILGEDQFSITLDQAYQPYFYQLKALDVNPLPVSVLAPGCEIKDDGDGAYISGPFSEDLLLKTMLAPGTGYISHPSVTCGPYMMTAYDGKTVTLDLNPAYTGDHTGAKPSIPQIVLRVENPDDVINLLAEGEVDLVVRCARTEQITAGMDLLSGGDIAMKAYSRTGLSYISFCAEKGPTADVNVRKALALCLDKNNLITRYLGAYGASVKGYYGIGQWMFMMANGTLVPEEGAEEEWADLTLDNIPVYELKPEEAKNLLNEAGWNLSEDGSPYDDQTGGVRYKEIDGQLVPLKLKLIYPEGNGAGPLLKDYYLPYLHQAGIELETEALPMPTLLEMYYGKTDRDCDMILLGTNFGDVFDPSVSFDENGTDVLNGINDPHLLELAVAMRTTEPGNAPEYCRRWLAFQEYREEVLPEIPLYSDAYLDFHVVELQNYEPGSMGNWSVAVTSAILSDYIPPAPEEDEDEFEFE